MTIGNIAPKKERKSRKGKQVDDKSPLLPKREEDVSFDEFNGASFSGAVFNLSTTIVGAGIMALPATMKVLGLVVGVAMIVFMAILTEASIELLLRFSRAGKVASYGGLMGDAFGKCGRILLQLAVLVNNIGVLIVYMIIIGDVLSGTSSSGVHHAGILQGWFGEQWWNGRTFVLLVTTLTVFSPLACFKRIGWKTRMHMILLMSEHTKTFGRRRFFYICILQNWLHTTHGRVQFIKFFKLHICLISCTSSYVSCYHRGHYCFQVDRWKCHDAKTAA